MLVIYRTNEGFAGDVVTVMTGDAALTAALTGEDAAVLDVALDTEQAAALILNPGSYMVSGGSLCEREGQSEALAKSREELSGKVAAVSDQVAAVAAAPILVEPSPIEVVKG